MHRNNKRSPSRVKRFQLPYVLPPSKEALDMSLGDIDYIASGSIDNRACCEAHWMPPSVEEASLLKLEAAVYNVIEETASEDHNIQGSQCVKVLARLLASIITGLNHELKELGALPEEIDSHMVN
jgi:hypothetical protein